MDKNNDLSKELVQKAEPTAGDSSSAAATSDNVEISTQFIPFATPAGENRQNETFRSASITGATFLDPPEDPSEMYKMYQLSAFLAPVMDALETNVYKAPFHLKPVYPFDRPAEAKEVVKDLMMWEAAKNEQGGLRFDETPDIDDDAVEQMLESLKRRSKIEEQFLNRFFQEVVPDTSFRQLCALTGQDYEITGNAYWEVIRDTAGNIARIQWLPSVSMRATRQEYDAISTTKLVKDGFKWVPTPQIRRFRRYVQLHNGGDTYDVSAWFKEFGDPRVLSRRSGKYYKKLEELQRAESDHRDPDKKILPATEVLHFKLLFGGSSVYGKPRWSGMYIPLRGSRDLDEENQRIVGDEAVPSLMLLVSGGIIGQKAYDRLKNQIEERKKGRKGIMIVEAVASGKGPVSPSQQPSIDVEKLKSEQNTDMLFQNYDIRNEDKTAGSWRIPKTVLGKAGANRATSQSERQFGEDQVFTPLRADKDEPINTSIFSSIGITCWTFETQSMQPRDPQQRAEILKLLVEAGIVTPNEGRELASPIFSQRLDDLQGLWTMLPPRVLTVLLQTKNAELAATLLGDDKDALANLSNTIRDTLGLGSDGAAAQTVEDFQTEETTEE